jgi:hypothetical protein
MAKHMIHVLDPLFSAHLRRVERAGVSDTAEFLVHAPLQEGYVPSFEPIVPLVDEFDLGGIGAGHRGGAVGSGFNGGGELFRSSGPRFIYIFSLTGTVPAIVGKGWWIHS